jgi:hypothetical protein
LGQDSLLQQVSRQGYHRVPLPGGL